MPNSRAGVRRPPPWLWHEGLVLSYSIHKDGLVINAVELVGDGSLHGNLDGARGEFGNHDADGSGGGGVDAIGLLQIEGAAGEVIGLAPGINRDGIYATAPTPIGVEIGRA